MQTPHDSINVSYRSLTSPLDSSNEDLDNCLEYDLDDIEKIAEHPRKPHFLDYDYVPPQGFVENINEHLKMDKKYETDGERKAEKSNTGTKKKAIFSDDKTTRSLDTDKDREREHRSLDRNFDRLRENINLKYDQNLSLERNDFKRKDYSIPKFLDRDVSPIYHRVTWPSDRPNESHLLSGQNMGHADNIDLGPKVECVYSLLSMLGSHNSVEMSTKFVELSKTPETCSALRRSGCIPLLVQMMHSDSDEGVRKRAGIALHNVVHCHPDDKVGRREAKVLRLVEQIMEYNDFLKKLLNFGESVADDMDRHPSQIIYSLMKVSFDEDHRHAMCLLGALPAIANLVYLDHAAHGNKSQELKCVTLRRYSGMALTNLTFGDGNNKALLCANKHFMKALVAQLDSSPEELIQVTACVLRNLSWRADNNMKAVLTEIGTVTALTKAAMKNSNENTLKSILSALWNLTAHCSMNKAELCNVEGALGFLADMLMFEAPGKNLAIVENAGGILRNVSSHIAVREDYRKILRERNCLGILLQQLKSESLTVVSNACGTLWNLSARCPEDQKYLCDNSAVPMLRSLVHSKHKMISNGSNAALKNLLNFKPTGINTSTLDPIAKSMGLKELPSLNMRKKRALEQELARNLSETCENIDIITPPKEEQNVQDFCNLEQSNNNFQPTKDYSIRLPLKVERQDKIKLDDEINKKKDDSTKNNKPDNENFQQIQIENKEKKTEIKNNYNNDESENDQLTDFSIKYNREAAQQKVLKTNKTNLTEDDDNESENNKNIGFNVYQETDLDQITDYSLLYAENHLDSEDKGRSSNSRNFGNDILVLEDTVKCYQTEGTPYTISNATSLNDLRLNKEIDKSTVGALTTVPTGISTINDSAKIKVKNDRASAAGTTTAAAVATTTTTMFSSGINTPDKPTKYCEEGTPEYFSRRDSMNSIDETNVPTTAATTVKIENRLLKNDKIETKTIDVKLPLKQQQESDINLLTLPTTPSSSSLPKVVTFVDFAQETPLMFSRHSSLESLSSAEPECIDDRSSIVSDFSRLASGIISPSELPDSPTQSMPETVTVQNIIKSSSTANNSRSILGQPQQLQSIFEDNINEFIVENTPAQFSSATSLSNLSLDDEPNIITDCTKNIKQLNNINTNSNSNDESNIERKLNDYKICETPLSDGDESSNDGILLATCINIGINNCVSKSQNDLLENRKSSYNNNIPSSSIKNINNDCMRLYNNTDDNIKEYYTEDTPALLSKVGSNSNLSILSLDTNKGEIVSDESSNGSDIGNDKLFEECIREGMQKIKQIDFQLTNNINLDRENPIGMLRSGSMNAAYSTQMSDEINKFNVEDSPCNFSVLSALSEITIGSDVADLVKLEKPMSKLRGPINQYISGDESLSSLSIDSEDDTNLLNQAIQAGFNSKPKHDSSSSKLSQSNVITAQQKFIESSSILQIPSNTKASTSSNQILDANDSLSSIGSCESIENNQTALFEQCIKSGMHKEHNTNRTTEIQNLPENNINLVTQSSPKKSQLPMYKTPTKCERDRQKDRDKKDEQLLLECITTGMSKSRRSESQTKSVRHLKQDKHQQDENNVIDLNEKISNINLTDSFPKNGQATSVIVSPMKKDINTIADVETDSLNDLKELKRDQYHLNTILTKQNGYEINFNLATNGINLLELSQGSLNISSNENILECSNEFPALKLSNFDYTDESLNETSIDMELSNEFLMDNFDSIQQKSKFDKHKDPDLMLKSVERLTQELVSTAEYLRTTTSNIGDESSSTVNEQKSASSNNTWNENTCPNDVSFPSISMTAPIIIQSSNDDDDDDVEDDNTFSYKNQHTNWTQNLVTPTNETINISQEFRNKIFIMNSNLEKNSLLTHESDEIPHHEINFHVGGEVQHTLCNESIPYFLSSGSMSFDTTTTMSNSTIIAMEANRLVDELKYMNSMTDSITSLDLDNIRPPSVMDNLSISGYVDNNILQSPQLSRSRKKSLAAGIVARRAIAHVHTNGSLESINLSLNNIDNVKPPSIMDELLDSMISVASITSEIADNNNLSTNNLDAISHYDTALSDIDDTMTLQSCLDIPNDSTPNLSDFSSAESTPKKNFSLRKCMTPKQKRQLIKDRYRTYTIAADMILSQKTDDEDDLINSKFNSSECLNDDVKMETDDNIDENKQKRTPKQKRQDDRLRFQTQILNSSSQQSLEESNNRSFRRHHSEDPNRYLTQTIILHDNLLDDKSNIINCNINNSNLIKLTPEKLNTDYNSCDYEQNSETESCNQNRVTDNVGDFATFTKQKPKINTKQNMVENCTEEENIKINAVRGRKKAAYVSPYRQAAITKKTTPNNNSSPSMIKNKKLSSPKPICRETSKVHTTSAKLIPRKQTIVTNTHVVINKANLTNKINSFKSNLTKTKIQNTNNNKNIEKTFIKTGPTTIIEKSKTIITNTKTIKRTTNASNTEVIDRQGTFVKDEPRKPDVPIVTSEPSSPAKSRIPSKITYKKTVTEKSFIKPNNNQTKLTPTFTQQTKIQLNKIQLDTHKRIGISKSPSVPNVPQRSKSNTSMKITTLTTTTSTSPSTTTTVNKKVNITSKIAGLWKKGEYVKKQQEQQTNNNESGSSKLIRSFTFDNTPK